MGKQDEITPEYAKACEKLYDMKMRGICPECARLREELEQYKVKAEASFASVHNKLEQAERERDCYKIQFEKDYNESDQFTIMRLSSELAAEREAHFLTSKALELACEELSEYRRKPHDGNFMIQEFTDYFRKKAQEGK